LGLLDYHAKYLLPSVWDSDGMGLTMRFRSQLRRQLEERFPDAIDVWLVGDAVSHYWRPDSDVDVLISAPEDVLSRYRNEANAASGFPLAATENQVFFYPVKESLSPNVIARHFGPLYSMYSGLWYGNYVRDEMELRRPSALLQRINWMLFKVKRTLEPFPYEWRMTREAFRTMPPGDREEVLDALRYRIANINHRINRMLRNYPKEVWRDAELFEVLLNEDEEVDASTALPPRLQYAILNRFRYRDVLDTLEMADEKMQTYENRRS